MTRGSAGRARSTNPFVLAVGSSTTKRAYIFVPSVLANGRTFTFFTKILVLTVLTTSSSFTLAAHTAYSIVFTNRSTTTIAAVLALSVAHRARFHRRPRRDCVSYRARKSPHHHRILDIENASARVGISRPLHRLCNRNGFACARSTRHLRSRDNGCVFGRGGTYCVPDSPYTRGSTFAGALGGRPRTHRRRTVFCSLCRRRARVVVRPLFRIYREFS